MNCFTHRALASVDGTQSGSSKTPKSTLGYCAGHLNKKDQCGVCPTRHHCIAAELSHADLQALQGSAMNIRQFKSGEHLFRSNEPAQKQCSVRSGTFKTYATNHLGDEYVTGFYLTGEAIPSGIQSGKHTHSAIALNEATVCSIDLELPGISSTHAVNIWPHLHQQLSDMATHAITHQALLKCHSAEQRFAGFCTDLMQRLSKLGRTPVYIDTPMTRSDIASYLGLTLESLSRVVTKLRKADVIAADRHHIEVLNTNYLTAQAPQYV